MAEIVGLLGFGIAVPGVAISFAQCGKYMVDRFSAFKNAPENVLQIRSFFEELYQGKLKTNIELAEWAFKVPGIDPDLKSALQKQLERLKDEIRDSDVALRQLTHPDGSLRLRVRLSEFFGLTPVRKILQNLEKWQEQFQGSISLLAMKKLVVGDDRESKESAFMAHGGGGGEQLSPGCHLWIGTGEVSDNGERPREISFVIERLEKHQYGNETEAKEVASLLARRLAGQTLDRGILPCLGYRGRNGLELVFEVPKGFSQPQTLRSLLVGDVGKGYGGGRPLDHRFRLARQISEAVLAVHTAQLVHKNICPDNIVIFQRDRDPTKPIATPLVGQGLTELGIPFLTNWRMVRQVNDLSARIG